MGVEARCCLSKSAAHHCHMKRQPFLCDGRPCHAGAITIAVAISVADSIAIAVAVAVTVAVAVAIAIAIAHCRCCCRRPLPLRSLSTIATAISIVLPSAITVTVALAINHCHLRHRWPSQLPLPSAITVTMPLAIVESCCLGPARIVFDQSKQRMLTLFYFVWTVGGVLIEAGLLTRCRLLWAASSEQ
jgi:hypothetical protein